MIKQRFILEIESNVGVHPDIILEPIRRRLFQIGCMNFDVILSEYSGDCGLHVLINKLKKELDDMD